MVALTILAIALSATLLLLRAQQQLHARALHADARNAAVRTVLEVLSAELRGVSPGAGDLYGIGPDSVALRARRGFGVVCEVLTGRLRLRAASGTFGSAAHDSVLVFLERRVELAGDDGWRAVRVIGVRRGGARRCPDGHAAGLDLVLDTLLRGVIVGAPVRAFRPYVYRVYQRGGRWWLGQRVRGGSLQPVAGPLAAPEAGGLRLRYVEGTTDAAGTGVLRGTARVHITARGETPNASAATIVVQLRNP